MSDDGQQRRPTRRERFRPVELVAFAAICGVFTGLIVLAASREPQLAGIFAGIGFIAALLVLAMLALAAGDPGTGDIDRPVLDRDEPASAEPDASAEPPADGPDGR